MSAKGEKYASKKAMMKHEGSEGSKERKMEYGTAKKAKLGSGARFKTVAAAAKKGGTLGRRARLAETLKGFKK